MQKNNCPLHGDVVLEIPLREITTKTIKHNINKVRHFATAGRNNMDHDDNSTKPKWNKIFRNSRQQQNECSVSILVQVPHKLS